MDVTPIRNDSYDEGRLFQDILPYRSISKKKSAADLFLNGNTKQDSDAIVAVQMDPAVLEAHINIDSRKYVHVNSDAVQYEVPEVSESLRGNFEEAMRMERAALLSLSSQKFNLLMRYVKTLREQRESAQKTMECAFCKKNGERTLWYTTHMLKDRQGRVRCPVLRAYTCRRCGATGDNAHTSKYCPSNTL